MVALVGAALTKQTLLFKGFVLYLILCYREKENQLQLHSTEIFAKMVRNVELCK